MYHPVTLSYKVHSSSSISEKSSAEFPTARKSRLLPSFPFSRFGYRARDLLAQTGDPEPRGEPPHEGGRGGRLLRGRGRRRDRNQGDQAGARGLGRSQHLKNVI